MITHKNYRYSFGTTRNVFILWNYAFKVPAISEWRLFLLGLLANMQEVSFGTMKHPKFCPVMFYFPFGLLVVMQRARIMTDEEFNISIMKEWVEEGNLSIPCELKPDSFGWVDSKIVVIDYGN